MNLHSIQVRLIAWYSGLIIVVSLVFAAYIYRGVEHRLYADAEQTMTRRIYEIANNILTHIPPERAQDIAEQIKVVYTPEANGRFIRVLKDNNEILYVSGTPKYGHFDPKAVPLPAPDLKGEHIEKLGNFSLQMVTIPVDVNGRKYQIEMGAPTEQAETALHGLVLTLLYGLPVVILIVSGGGYLLVQNALKPVERIRATAAGITFGNLSNRLPIVHTGDEIEHLSVTLNQMLERLDEAYQQARRFSADASHELRTPLSIMRTELESAVQEPEISNELRERVGIILDETERLSRITENLFAISMLDAGEAKIRHERIDLGALAKNTAEQMALMAEEKKITLALDIKEISVFGDAERLKQVVINLLDNAIKYTPQGGKVTLRAEPRQHSAVLEVRDSGIGISPEALPHVFERFYRADKARSRIEGGGGLGLSIVRSIVQAHGGTATIESSDGVDGKPSGTVCRIELPLANNGE